MEFPSLTLNICDDLRDLVPFVQIKNREKHSWRSVTFSKVAGLACNLTRRILLHACFSRFLDCTNGIKSHKTSHINSRWGIARKYPDSVLTLARITGKPRRVAFLLLTGEAGKRYVFY